MVSRHVTIYTQDLSFIDCDFQFAILIFIKSLMSFHLQGYKDFATDRQTNGMVKNYMLCISESSIMGA
jgi:hypothetical protein